MKLTLVLEFVILFNCPDCKENDIFKLPEPITMDSSCGVSTVDIYPPELQILEERDP